MKGGLRYSKVLNDGLLYKLFYQVSSVHSNTLGVISLVDAHGQERQRLIVVSDRSDQAYCVKNHEKNDKSQL